MPFNFEDYKPTLLSKQRAEPEPEPTTIFDALRQIPLHPGMSGVTGVHQPIENLEWTDDDIKTVMEGQKSLAKGVAVGLPAGVMDLGGMASQVFNWSQRELFEAVGFSGELAPQIPVRTGDPLREMIGLDPEDVNGMVGEMFGGWENAIAKAPVYAGKLFGVMLDYYPQATLAYLMSRRPKPGQVNTLIGELGDNALSVGTKRKLGIGSMAEAEARLDAGENIATVIGDTGWYRGSDGVMKVYIPDNEVRISTKKIKDRIPEGSLAIGEQTSIQYWAEEIIQADYIFEAYPDLRNTLIDVHVERVPNGPGGQEMFTISNSATETLGSFDYMFNKIHLHNLKEGAKEGADAMRSLRETLVHEINHKIQMIEGMSTGAAGDVFTQVSHTFADSQMDYRLLQAIRDDAIDPLDMGADGMYLWTKQQLDKMNVLGDTPEGMIDNAVNSVADRVLRWSMLSPAELDQEVLLAARVYERAITDAATTLRLGNKTPVEMLELLKGLDNTEAWHFGFRRYLAQGGEVDSRLQEFLIDKTNEEVRRLAVAKGGFENLIEIEPVSRKFGLTVDDIVPTDELL